MLQAAGKVFRKQSVVAVERALVVHRENEEVSTLEALDDLPGVAPPQDLVAERCAEGCEHRALFKEVHDVRRQPSDYLLGEQITQVPVLAGELLDEPLGVLVAS